MKRFLLSFFISVFSAGIALAQGDAPAATQPTQEEAITLMSVLEKGGFMMYPLAGLSAITIMLVFFYLLTLRRNAVVSDKFMGTAEALIRKRDYLGLVAHCSKLNQSIARVTEKTLDFMTKNSGVSFKEVREVAESEGSRQAGMLSQRISYLSDIGAIAPMVGLLGTVIGMIKSFHNLSQRLDDSKQLELASGVSEALITTASGLIIGIVAVVFYSLFRGRVQKYIAELEAAATHLMALLAAQSNRRSNNAVPQQAEYGSQQVPPTIEDDYGRPAPTQARGPSPIEELRPDIESI